MVSLINLGNFYTDANGKVLQGGAASGIDTKTIVDSLVKAKQIPATQLQTKIDANTKISAALKTIQQDLKTFQAAADNLRNPPGVGNAADNVFQYRKGTVASNSGVAGSTYLSITAQPGAPLGSYDIKVDQLATTSIKTTNTFALATADTSAVGGGAPFNAGTLTLGASSTPVTINNGDTLNQIAAKVNAVSDQSHVQASVLQISTGQYRLSFKTTETGAANNYDIVTPNAAFLNGMAFAQNTAAVDAQITLDGTTVSRSKNSISDLVNGITFDLNGVTPPSTDLTVNIGNDPDLIKTSITNFVNAYNALKLDISKQTALGTDGKPLADSVLAGNSTVTLANSQISAELSSTVAALTAGDPSQLADIGIAFDDYQPDANYPFTRNILTIDDAKLTSAISSNFESVKRIFEFDFSSNDANMGVFSHTKDTAVSDFTVHMDPTNIDPLQQFYATYLDSGGVTQSVQITSRANAGGFTLTGKAGTVLDGLVMVYAKNQAATVDVTLSQGVGDRIYNAVNSMVDPTTGTFTTAVNNVSDQSTRYKTDIDRINTQAETYRQQLLRQYAALEQAISSANTLLQSLDANSKAQQANN